MVHAFISEEFLSEIQSKSQLGPLILLLNMVIIY